MPKTFSATRIFLFLLPFIFCFKQSNACLCPEVPYDSAFARANVVFSGTVKEIATNWVSGGLKITFEVDRSWKRQIERYAVVNTESELACGYPFTVGQQYLVWVNKGFALKTSVCERTQLLSAAGEELERLGNSIETGQSGQMNTLMIVMSGLVLAGMGFLAFVVLRNRKSLPKEA